MHADLTALNAQFHTAAAALTALAADPAPVKAPEGRFSPTAQEREAYYAGKARMAAEAEATSARLKAARLDRKVQRLIATGWTVDAAWAHAEGTCDIAVCTGEHLMSGLTAL